MNIDSNQYLRLSAQRALITQITASLRAVSVELISRNQLIRARYVFDGYPDDSILDAIYTAGSEMMADYPSPWQIREEVVDCPWPAVIDHLELVVYQRCEDNFVAWREDAKRIGNVGESEHDA